MVSIAELILILSRAAHHADESNNRKSTQVANKIWNAVDEMIDDLRSEGGINITQTGDPIDLDALDQLIEAREARSD